jgi:hypothetical protein
MPNFIFVDSKSTQEPGARRTVRSQAMRDFRRRQRLGLISEADQNTSAVCHATTTRTPVALLPKHGPTKDVLDYGIQSLSLEQHASLVKKSLEPPPPRERLPWEFSCGTCLWPDAPKYNGKYTGSRTRQDERSAETGTVISLPGTLTPWYHRHHMRDTFCDLFYPAGSGGTDDLFYKMRPAPWAEQLTLDASDALCLLQVAVAYKDRKLLQASMQLHDSALQRLRSSFRRIKRPSSAEHFIGAVYYLLKWESVVATSLSSAAWQFHFGALSTILRLKGVADPTETSELPGYLRFTFFYAVDAGLLSRKSVPQASVYEKLDSRLVSPALRVPPCLAVLDAARKCQNRPKQVSKAIGHGFAVRQVLLEAISDYSSSSEGRSSFCSVAIAHYPPFEAALDSDVVELYPTVYIFSSFVAALALKTLWSCLLVLDQTLADLLQQHNMPELRRLHAAGLEREMDDCANHLCRSLPFFSNPESKTSGLLSSQEPLQFAGGHFKSRGAARHVAWCSRVSEAIILGCKISRMLKGED